MADDLSLIRPLELLRRFVESADGPGQRLFRLVLAIEAVAAWLAAVGAGELERQGSDAPFLVLDTLEPSFGTWVGAVASLRRRLRAAPDELAFPMLPRLLDAWIDLVATTTDLPTVGGSQPVSVRELRNHLAHTVSYSALHSEPLVRAFDQFFDVARSAFGGATLLVSDGATTWRVPHDPERALELQTGEPAASGYWLVRDGFRVQVWPIHRIVDHAGLGWVDEVFTRWSPNELGPRYVPFTDKVAISFGGLDESAALRHRFARPSSHVGFWEEVTTIAAQCVGRDMLIDDLVARLVSETGPRRYWFTAAMGSGKTTVAAATAVSLRQTDMVVVVHLFREHDRRCSFDSFLDSVFDALDPGAESSSMSAAAKRDHAMDLIELAADSVVVVCDGLDELDLRQPTGVARLAELALKTSARWLVSSRRNPVVRQHFGGGRFANPFGASNDLPDLSPAGLELIIWTRGPELVADNIWKTVVTADARSASPFVEVLIDRSDGNPQFVMLTLALLVNRPAAMVIRDLGDPEWIPRGLKAAIRSAIADAATGDDAMLPTDVLCLLAEAAEPLTSRQIAILSEASNQYPDPPPNAAIGRAIERLSGLVKKAVTPEGEDAWAINHASVRPVLNDPTWGRSHTRSLQRARLDLAAASFALVTDPDVARTTEMASLANHFFRHSISYLRHPELPVAHRGRFESAVGAALLDNRWLGDRLDADNPVTVDHVLTELESEVGEKADSTQAASLIDRRRVLGSYAHYLRSSLPDGFRRRHLLDQIDALTGDSPDPSVEFEPCQLTRDWLADHAHTGARVLSGHTDAVRGAAQLSDGNIVTWSWDSARLWTGEGEPLAVLAVDGVSECRVVDSDRFVALSSGGATLFGSDGGPVARLGVHGSGSAAGAVGVSGGSVLTWDWSGSGWLWSRDGALLAHLEGHVGAIGGATEIADGSLLTWGKDRTARIWSSDGTPLATLTDSANGVGGAIGLDNGDIVTWCDDSVVAPPEEVTDHGWGALSSPRPRNAKRRRSPSPPPPPPPPPPDPNLVVPHDVRIWRSAGGEPVVLRGHERKVIGAIQTAPDVVVTWSEDGSCRAWNLAGEERACLRAGIPSGHGVSDVYQTSTGELVVMSYGSTQIWRYEVGSVVTIERWAGLSQGCVELASGDLLIFGGHSAGICSLSGEVVSEFNGHSGSLTAAIALEDGNVLTCAYDKTARIWDSTAPAGPSTDKDTGEQSGGLQLSDGQVLIWPSNAHVHRWTAEGRPIDVLGGRAYYVADVIELSDGRFVVFSRSRAATVFNLRGVEEALIEGHTDWLTGGRELSDGSIVTWSHDQTAMRWSLVGTQLAVLEGHEDFVDGVLELSTGNLITWSRDGTVRSWSPDGTPIDVLDGGEGCGVVGVERQSDDTVVAWWADGVARAWTAESAVRYTVEGVDGAREVAAGVLLTWSRDGSVRSLGAEGNVIATMKGHSDSVTGGIALGGGRLLTWSADGTARSWSSDGRSLNVLAGHMGPVLGARQFQDGRVVTWSRRCMIVWSEDLRCLGFLPCEAELRLLRDPDMAYAAINLSPLLAFRLRGPARSADPA